MVQNRSILNNWGNQGDFKDQDRVKGEEKSLDRRTQLTYISSDLMNTN